jgi:hypothetical protein
MDDPSLLSSGFSAEDRNEEAIMKKMRILLDTFFMSSAEIEESSCLTAIDTVHFMSVHNRHLFRIRGDDRDKFFYESVQVLLTFGIRKHVLRWTFQVRTIDNRTPSEVFMESITNLFLVCPPYRLSQIFDELLSTISDIAARRTFLLPIASWVESYERFPSDNQDELLEFFLQMVLKLTYCHLFSSPAIFRTLAQCYEVGSEAVRILVIRCVADVTPLGILSSVSLMRIVLLILRFEVKWESNLLSNLTMDECLANSICRAFGNVDLRYQGLIAREILRDLGELAPFANTCVSDVILNTIRRFLENDDGFGRFAVGFFLDLFPKYLGSDCFVGICKQLCDLDQTFGSELLKRFGDCTKDSNLIFIPVLVKLFPDHEFKFDLSSIRSPELIYEICATANHHRGKFTIDSMRHILQKTLASFNLPEIRLLPQLMEFVPREIMSLFLNDRYPNLDPNVIGKILKKTSQISFAPFENDLVRRARASKALGLVTSLAHLHCNVSGLLLELANDPISWTHPSFCQAMISIIKEDNFPNHITDDILNDLFSSCNFKSLIVLSHSEKLLDRIFTFAFQRFLSDSVREAGGALTLIKQFPDLDIALDRRRYAICGDIFNLARSIPRNGSTNIAAPEFRRPRAITLLDIFYQTRKFKPVIGNILPGLIAAHDREGIAELVKLVGGKSNI